MLSEAYPSFGVDAPPADQPPIYALVLYVADADATVAAAERAGLWFSTVEDVFDGPRRGTIVDPFGIRWMLGTHLQDVTEAKPHRRERRLRRQLTGEAVAGRFAGGE
jgi:PhnB protein